MTQSKQTTASLNSIAGVRKTKSTNQFKPLKDTLTFEKQGYKWVVFNYNKGDSVFDYTIIATFPTMKQAREFIKTTKQ